MEASKAPVRTTADRQSAEDWVLVLVALGLSPSLNETRNGYVVSVPEANLQPARAALALYDRENPTQRPVRDGPIFPSRLRSGAAIGVMLLVFFVIVALSDPPLPWLERGSADARRMLGGEPWRAVTALTIHADIVHVLSNAVAAAVFCGALYGLLGVGFGSIFLLAAGAGGNLINALVQGPPHVSLGASTAIFAAVGMLGILGRARLRRREKAGRRAWLPATAALALLAMLGTGGPRVDVLAHLLGFLLGCLFGAVLGPIAQRPPSTALQWTFGSAALALVLGSWMLALR